MAAPIITIHGKTTLVFAPPPPAQPVEPAEESMDKKQEEKPAKSEFDYDADDTNLIKLIKREKIMQSLANPMKELTTYRESVLAEPGDRDDRGSVNPWFGTAMPEEPSDPLIRLRVLRPDALSAPTQTEPPALPRRFVPVVPHSE